MMKVYTFSVLFICTLFASAQVDTTINNILEEVVITAQHEKKTVGESVHLVRVVNRRQIAEQAAVNLRDLLRMETGMRVSQDNILGSAISIQGLSGQNVKVLIDGVPVIGRLNGNIDLSQINLNTIERIELIEGPLSVNYGTDALAGTINLITKKQKKTGRKIHINNYWESVGQYNTDGDFSYKKGAHIIGLSGGRRFFDGWNPNDAFFKFPVAEPADTNRSIQWNMKGQHFGKLDYTFNKGNFHFSPYLSSFQEKITNRGFPKLPYYENAFDDFYYTYRNNVGIKLKGKLPWGDDWNILTAYNDFKRIKNTYFNDLTTLESTLIPGASNQDTSWFGTVMSRGSFIYSNELLRSSFEFGYDANFEQNAGRRILDNKQSIGDYAIYATAEIEINDNVVIRPGIRTSHNTAYLSPVIPSLNLKYTKGDYTVRGSYASGFRAPSLKELYFEFVDINHNIFGNPDLQAEKSHNFSGSYLLSKRMDNLFVTFNQSVFYNHIFNLISLGLVPGTEEYSYINIGLFKSTGMSGDINFNTSKINALIGWSYIGRYNHVSEFRAVEPFSFSPELRSRFTYSMAKLNMKMSVFWKYTGRTPSYNIDGDDEIQLGFVEDYHTLNLTITKNFEKKGVSLSLGGKNLMNVQNVGVTGGGSVGGAHSSVGSAIAMNWGRSLFMSINYNLK
ncbi:MAG TPA: hypothetical protein DCQ41_01865 [Cryomorphaceae bacterium]|nr:hypothetical protein [Cryomorphaceae bacterium]